MADTRCHHIVVLDVSAVSPITDFMVIATGTSPRQMKTAAEDLEEMAAPRQYRPMSRAGDNGAHWTCIDFVDVVVHLFSQDARMFYDLEGLWGDAQRVEWGPPASTEAGSGGAHSEAIDKRPDAG